jgi:hypothetical protein
MRGAIIVSSAARVPRDGGGEAKRTARWTAAAGLAHWIGSATRVTQTAACMHPKSAEHEPCGRPSYEARNTVPTVCVWKTHYPEWAVVFPANLSRRAY